MMKKKVVDFEAIMDEDKGNADVGAPEGDKTAYFTPEEGIMTPMKPAEAVPEPNEVVARLNIKFNKQLVDMMKKAKAIKVDGDVSCDKAVEMTNQVAKLKRELIKAKEIAARRYLDVIQALNSFIKHPVAECAKIKDTLDGKILPYLEKKEAEEREQRRIAKIEAKKLQEEEDRKAEEERERVAEETKSYALSAGHTDADAEAMAEEAADEVKAAIVEVDKYPEPGKIKTAAGTAKVEKEWDFEILDIRKMPDAMFKARNKQLEGAVTPWIRTQMKAGNRNITGVRFFQKKKLKTRAT